MKNEQLANFPADDARVVATEAEAIVHGGGDHALDRFDGRVIEIAIWVWVDQVDRRRDYIVKAGQGG